MNGFNTRLVIGASALALLFGGLSGTAVAAADEAGPTATKRSVAEKREHRKVRKVASFGSTGPDTCNAKCQLAQHFNNYGYAEARIFIPSNDFNPSSPS